MKEYEIVAKFYNACAGASRPQTFFEEAELSDPGAYVRMKHGKTSTNSPVRPCRTAASSTGSTTAASAMFTNLPSCNGETFRKTFTPARCLTIGRILL